ncbi:MAG: hypothetical protein AAGF97_12680, partial [Planctomycetota bacterium]
MTKDSEHGLIDEIADEYLARCLRGSPPEIADYCQAYPWLEDEIRRLLSTLSLIEANKKPRA